MPGIFLRVDSRMGRSRIHVDPSDSVASLARDVAARLGLEGDPAVAVRLSQGRHGDGVFANPSASLRMAGMKNGDTVFAAVVAVVAAGETGQGEEKQGQRQHQHGEESTKDDGAQKSSDQATPAPTPHVSASAAAASSTAAVLHASLEATDEGQHCRKFILDSRIVPSAPTLAGRIVQRARMPSAAAVGGRRGRRSSFTERTPLTDEDAQQYESWNDYVALRGCELMAPPKIERTRLTRRGANALPDTITVKRQGFRHVDRVVLANDPEFRQFAASWLSSRRQHIGFLYGTYETPAHGASSVRVEAIYEPPQERGLSGARLSNVDHDAPMVKAVADLLGLEPVGWMFTHAPREELLTCAEIRAAAQYQNANLVGNNLGGQRSRFLTLTLSTNTSGAICPRAFMVSEQGMSFERDGLMQQTKDWPECMSIRNPGKGFVFPIVLADMQASSRARKPLRLPRRSIGKANKMPPQSFPAELLLVDLSVAEAVEGRRDGLFASRSYRSTAAMPSFPIENRGARQPDDSAKVAIVHRYLQRALARSPRPSLDALLKDFHLLIVLPSVLGFDLTARICRELVSGRPLTKHTRLLVEAFVATPPPRSL
jgi:hypothetical protein